MNLRFLYLKFVFLLIQISTSVFSQSLPSRYPVLDESLRRSQLFDDSQDSIFFSYLQSPSLIFPTKSNLTNNIGNLKYGLIPIRSTVFFNSYRPYWNSPQGMIPSKGGQIYISGGGYILNKYFEIDFQPEVNVSKNSAFSAYRGFNQFALDRRFFINLGRGDAPETYGEGPYSRIGLGQSKIVGKLGAFELGISTRNLWWGPGQWNALTFSNNAPGFLHGVLGTHRPAKTFFGAFEFQLISGLPKSKKYIPTQNEVLNLEFDSRYPNRDRYLNALNVSISPKWIKGLSIGAARTVQTFSDSVSVSNFIDVFPVFWGVSKQSVGSDLVGESDRGRDQQITVFFRQVIPKAGIEFYGEFGRRDHALNLRDLTLSPAHSRAYILGLNKVFHLTGEKLIQIRSEMTQQSQSVNWVVRANSTTPWGTNGTIGGFTNWDQAMGVGAGMGANVQMVELSLVENINKLGLYLERRAPFADFYDTADLKAKGYEPWVDFTAGPVFDHQWGNMIFSGRMLFTYATNYYWSQTIEGHQDLDFPGHQSVFSTSAQFNFIYLFNRDKK